MMLRSADCPRLSEVSFSWVFDARSLALRDGVESNHIRSLSVRRGHPIGDAVTDIRRNAMGLMTALMKIRGLSPK